MPPLDKTKITDELEQLQLEEARERVIRIRGDRASRKRRLESNEMSLRREAAVEEAQKQNCWHKKGGKSDNLAHGNDANYSVVKHVLSHGGTIVICQRCSATWRPPEPISRKNATPEERLAYKTAWDEYQWALNLPTDNEPSGTQIFMVIKDETPTYA
jgi:hypothetical protein